MPPLYHFLRVRQCSRVVDCQTGSNFSCGKRGVAPLLNLIPNARCRAVHVKHPLAMLIKKNRLALESVRFHADSRMQPYRLHEEALTVREYLWR
jgi:hypothetical protein